MGEHDLDFSVVEEWKRELKKANDGKVGGALPLPGVVHQAPLTLAIQADGGFSHLPLQVREGVAGPCLPRHRQETERKARLPG